MTKNNEYNMTPLQVEKVATERLESGNGMWALAVARTCIKNNLSENWIKANPEAVEKLQNAIAQQLIIANNSAKK